MKFLILRFSSIGDIVLTSPVLRILHQASENHEIHFVTKAKFKEVVQHHPYVAKLHTFEKEITEIVPSLKAEKFDVVIDLHNNLRSHRLSRLLGVETHRFQKLNLQKWLKVNFKWDFLPQQHIVERYCQSLEFMNLQYDGQGLDYFHGLDAKDQMQLQAQLPPQFHAFVVGGAHYTKQIPLEVLAPLAQQSTLPIVLLGGPGDTTKAKMLLDLGQGSVMDFCGKLSLNQSAFVISQSQKVVTADTGLMHIAAAYRKPILMVWGNTIPQFGMSPLLPEAEALKVLNFEVALNCRPCSKIGFEKCPQNHFKCMYKQNVVAMIQQLNTHL